MRNLNEKFIPAITGLEPPDGTHRSIYALTLRLGGLNIAKPTASTRDYFDSFDLSNPLNNNDPIQAELVQNRLQQDIKRARIKAERTKLDSLKEALNQQTKYSWELASQKGGSSWLNAMPLKKYNFCLTKLEFRDGLDLRYGRELTKMPSICPWGANFNITHALHCAKVRYTHIRHYEI